MPWPTLEADTVQPESMFNAGTLPRLVTLTIAHHPDIERVGEQARLPELDQGQVGVISRLQPDFCGSDGHSRGPLRHRFISRKGLTLRATEDGVAITSDGGQSFSVDGQRSSQPRHVSTEALDNGVVITLGGAVTLVLKRLGPTALVGHGLVGVSDKMSAVSAEIDRVAPGDLPVLIRGESGTGKELVARAIHEKSGRSRAAYVPVNMGAIPEGMAAAELFGYERGAFTGAVVGREGYFGRAAGGTLFLDEVGEAPPAIQPVLLRALETGEVQPVGAAKSKVCDVRVLSATDLDLDAAVENGSFRRALLHRLSGYILNLPPLRARVEDIPVLFFHFLKQELDRHGKLSLLEPGNDSGWLSARFVAPLLAYAWPGNVRELRNVTQQVVAFSADSTKAALPPSLSFLSGMADAPRQRVQAAVPTVSNPPNDNSVKRPAQISDEELLTTLEQQGWRIAATARLLGISKNSLYALMNRSGAIRKASDLSEAEIRQAHREHHSDLQATAAALRVSHRALQLRMRQLKMADG